MVMNRLRQTANRLKKNLSNGKFPGGFDSKGSIITPSVPMISVLTVFSKPTLIYSFYRLKKKLFVSEVRRPTKIISPTILFSNAPLTLNLNI